MSIELKKVESRERSVFYDYVWNYEGTRYTGKWVGYNLQYMLLLSEPNSHKVNGYFGKEELQKYFNNLLKQFKTNPSFFERTKKEYLAGWEKLSPYALKKKKIQSIPELKEYFHIWIYWFGALCNVFIAPDMEGVPKPIQKEALRLREMTQEYADALDEAYLDFIQTHYPQYNELMHVITPEEIFSLEKKPLSIGKLNEIKERLNGFFIWKDKIYPLSEFENVKKKDDIYLIENDEGKTVLEKYLTREHSLFYCRVWHESDYKYVKPYLGFNFKNILFLRKDQTNLVSSWFDPKELELCHQTITKKINSEKSYFERVKKDYLNTWSKLEPFLSHKKKITTIQELRQFYHAWINWWCPMVVIFEAIDLNGLPRQIQEELLELRKMTQEYADKADSLFFQFFIERFPAHKEIVSVIEPQEVFQLGENGLNASELHTIRERLNGFALFNDQLIPFLELNSLLKQSNTTLAGELIKLSQIFSRDRALFYFCMWNESDRKGYEQYAMHKVKQNLFCKPEKDAKISVWYDKMELDTIKSNIARRVSGEKDFPTQLLNDLNQKWKELFLYLEKKKTIQTVQAFQEYYHYFVEWWTSMTIAFWIPDLGGVNPQIKAKFLSYREKAEKYSYIQEKLMLDFWEKQLPQHSDIIRFLTPSEAIALAQNKLSKSQLAAIRDRVNGYGMLNGQLFSKEELLKELENKNVELDGKPIKTNQILLKQYYSREYPLFCISIWCQSNTQLTKKWLGRNLKHKLFINEGNSKKFTTWSDSNDDLFFDETVKHIQKDSTFFPRLKQAFYLHWNALKTYLGKEKQINSFEELKKYYQHYLEWWAPMAILLEMHELKGIPLEIKKEAMQIRKEAESYSDADEDVLISFFGARFPEYNEIIPYLLPEEMLLLEKRKFTPNELKQIQNRKKGFVYYNNKLYPLEQLSTILEKNNLQFQTSPAVMVNEIKGKTAYPGKVSGIVHIIKTKADLPHFKEGEILVTEMTSPDYVPYMQKAAAVVTNEGGIVCHAAIACREMKIPCVIGTRNATQLLKDGIEIEVDANKGIVKVLPKSSFISKTTNGIPDLSSYSIKLEGGRLAYGYPNYTILQHGRAHEKNKWGVATELLTVIRDHQAYWYTMSPDQAKTKLLEKFIQKHLFLEEVEKDIETIRDSTLSLLQKENPIALSNAKLAEVMERYYEYYGKQMLHATVLRWLDRAVMPEFRKAFASQSNVDACIRIASTSDRLSAALQEEMELLELAVQLKKKKIKSISSREAQERIEHIYAHYCWNTCGYYTETPKSKTDYANTLKRLLKGNPEKELNEKKSKIRQELEEKEKLLSRFDERLRKISEIASNSTYLKDYFKFCINHMQFHAEPYFQEIAKRLNIPIGLLKDLFPNETIALLKGEKLDFDAIKQRIKHHVIVSIPNYFHVFARKQAEELENQYLRVESTHQTQFKGRATCHGYGKGNACIVLGPQDFHKLKKGNILIAINTSPDFVPIMRKAAAIVAEEGGLTSHVSVASREMGIPCVVGIQNITKHIRDGEIVEVDANNGIIRIL